jgi:NAD(P)H-flavin reductase
MYELFVTLHVPVSMVYIAMLFWHCKNYITSWSYLYATIAIWASSWALRLVWYLNWTKPMRMSWLIGDECAVTLMPENAIKITIPTQVKWKPGQYVYLRMPGISIFENHPFTVASLCSDDFPSEYGEGYRDMVIVFRPFGGFTNRVLKSALEMGPWHTYRAFIDGPYGGMRRRLDAFDNVVLIAGGSGITALVSQLLDLIKRMRDGKAVTTSVSVIWALKRPDTLEWFKEELRICREFAPPDSVQCQFFITAAKRQPKTGMVMSAQTPARPVSIHFHEKMNEAFQGIAEKRLSQLSTKRHSALIADEARGDLDVEQRLRQENEDGISALPQAHVVPVRNFSQKGRLEVPRSFAAHRGYESRTSDEIANDPDAITTPISPTASIPEFPMTSLRQSNRSKQRNLAVDVAAAIQAGHGAIDPALVDPMSAISPVYQPPQAAAGFDFGFPSTPTEFQKNLMRFAFLPAAVKKRDGWSTEYGRPQIPFMLREMSREWGRRTCVFVCGPPSMRIAVSREVAALQKTVLSTRGRDEIFLHAENYAI